MRRGENRCDWGQCTREPEPSGSAFCTFHADEWERVQQERYHDWWADG